MTTKSPGAGGKILGIGLWTQSPCENAPNVPEKGAIWKGTTIFEGWTISFWGAMCNIHIFRWFFVIPSTSTAQIGILEGWPCFATEKYHLPNLHFFRFHMLVFGGVSTLPRVPNSSPLNSKWWFPWEKLGSRLRAAEFSPWPAVVSPAGICKRPISREVPWQRGGLPLPFQKYLSSREKAVGSTTFVPRKRPIF